MVELKYITLAREPFYEVVRKYICDNSRILDVGSGNGSFARYFGLDDVYMVDANKNTCEELSKKYKNVFFADASKTLPFSDSFFTIIHCSHLIEHFYPEQLYSFLLECKRCLKIDGYLIISAPILWPGFYDDMSHVKPYNEKVLLNYLTCIRKSNSTREIIGGFSHVETVKRYYIIKETIININTGEEILQDNENEKKIAQNGYTIVFKKITDE